jgi:hypothetical protein
VGTQNSDSQIGLGSVVTPVSRQLLEQQSVFALHSFPLDTPPALQQILALSVAVLTGTQLLEQQLTLSLHACVLESFSIEQPAAHTDKAWGA